MKPQHKLAIKVCGMKHNPKEVASLLPDYLGFIFFEGSPRNVSESTPNFQSKIKKVGVFVDATIKFILSASKEHHLDVIQLHGDETPSYMKRLRNKLNDELDVWKVFSIKDNFNFEQIEPYEKYVDAFLFDTKGRSRGGNGTTFNWNVLDEYPSKTPIIISGGIGLEQIPNLDALSKSGLPVIAVDVNSKFEVEPGLKDIPKLKIFISEMRAKM